MKRDYIYLIVIAILVALFAKKTFTSDAPKSVSPTENPASEPPSLTPSVQEKSVREHIIPVKKGINMFEQFETTRTLKLEPSLAEMYEEKDFKDSRFIWFSMDELRSYFNYLRKVEKANRGKAISGIRFYFAAYPYEDGEKFKGQQTFFMAPTAQMKYSSKHVNMNHVPFYIVPTSSTNPLQGKFKPIEPLMLDFEKEERLSMFNKTVALQNSSMSNGAVASRSLQMNSFISSSILSAASTSLVEEEELSLLYNEGEATPPPKL